MTADDVTDARRSDPPPETYTDLFGEKKILQLHGIDMRLTPAAAARVMPLLSTKKVEPVVIVDGRLTACRVGARPPEPSVLVIQCGSNTTTSVSVKNGVMNREEHKSGDYADVIFARLGQSHP
jgi:hypothetical protein